MSDDDVTSSETSITSPSRTRLQPADESSSYDSVHHACTVKSPLIGSAVPEIADNIVPSRAKAYSKDFWILWLGILVLATAISLDVQTVPQFQSYALSTLHGSAWLASFSGIANFVYVVSWCMSSHVPLLTHLPATRLRALRLLVFQHAMATSDSSSVSCSSSSSGSCSRQPRTA